MKGENVVQNYITQSLELHLFFARIMKEHALFLEAGFSGINKEMMAEADWFKKEFELLLLDAINVSGSNVRKEVWDSGEIVTDYTLSTETKTEKLTGIPINKDLTIMEMNISNGNAFFGENVTAVDINNLNNRAIRLLDGLINFKNRIIEEMNSCNLHTNNYPLLVDHIMREAKVYRAYLIALENGEDIKIKDVKQEELFWDQIMMEHALFIRGLLDPSEKDLINASNNFANEYNVLITEMKQSNNSNMNNITQKNYQKTLRYRNFKEVATKGLNNCEIKSIILPLLADHILREANHYLRILKD